MDVTFWEWMRNVWDILLNWTKSIFISCVQVLTKLISLKLLTFHLLEFYWFSSENYDRGALFRFSTPPESKLNKHQHVTKHNALSQKVKRRGRFYLKEPCDWRILLLGQSRPMLMTEHWAKMPEEGKHQTRWTTSFLFQNLVVPMWCEWHRSPPDCNRMRCEWQQGHDCRFHSPFLQILKYLYYQNAAEYDSYMQPAVTFSKSSSPQMGWWFPPRPPLLHCGSWAKLLSELQVPVYIPHLVGGRSRSVGPSLLLLHKRALSENERNPTYH